MTNARCNYLVVWQEQLPALDLSLIIQDGAPSAQITVLPTLDEATAKLKSFRRPIVAIIEAEPAAFQNSDLAVELKRRAATVFLIGETGPTKEWGIFPIPFSDESVRQLLSA